MRATPKHGPGPKGEIENGKSNSSNPCAQDDRARSPPDFADEPKAKSYKGPIKAKQCGLSGSEAHGRLHLTDTSPSPTRFHPNDEITMFITLL
eukprot:1187324-Prorocentrum_minimum.AAC.3